MCFRNVPMIIILLLCLRGCCKAGANVNPSCNSSIVSNKLHIAVYYESLCSDSLRFIQTQLSPKYSEFKNHIELLFVPFGKAESENDGEAFFCQHGPAECMGNRIQSCVLDALNNDQEKSMQFVDCQMKRDSEFSGQVCAKEVNIEYASLLNCLIGNKGKELQLSAERQTHEIATPYPSFIPTIVYNRKYNDTLHWQSLDDFSGVLCNQLKEIYCEDLLPIYCTEKRE